eukprot:scaffold6002_cov70-Skeletonema_dohrnii-CCMP3373.AAC.3
MTIKVTSTSTFVRVRVQLHTTIAFDFLVPIDEDSGTLLVDQDFWDSASHSSGNDNGCADSTTIKEYLVATRNTVLCVGMSKFSPSC